MSAHTMNPPDSFRDLSSTQQSAWNSSPNLSNGNGTPSTKHHSTFQSPAQTHTMPARTDSFKSDNAVGSSPASKSKQQKQSQQQQGQQPSQQQAAAPQHDAQLLTFVGRYRDLQTHRDTLDDLTKDVLVYCQTIQTNLQAEIDRIANQLHVSQLDLVDATASRRDLQQRLQTAESHVDWMVTENATFKSRNQYVVVLIDGDNLVFQEKWLKQGLEGGKKAALNLRAAIEEQLGADSGEVEIIAKVIANQASLFKALKGAGSLDNAADLREFMLGFNQARATFDFIDVGGGKGRVESQIKEIARWHVKNYNCRHIAIGISPDTRYAPFIQELVADESMRQRLSIIEGVPLPSTFVAAGLSVVKLERDLFRTEKLTDRPSPIAAPAVPAKNAAAAAAAAASATAPTPAVRTISPETSANGSTGPVSWANVTSTGTPPPPPPQITLPLAAFNSKQQTRAKEKHDKAAQQALQDKGGEKAVYQKVPPEQPKDWTPGERGLDEPILVNVHVYETVKKRKESDKLCNNHFLRGPCAKGEACFFVHDYKPTDDELNAIAVLARQNPCTLGQYCENDDCIYGHHCPSVRDGVCVHPFCRFDEDQHPPNTKFSKTR